MISIWRRRQRECERQIRDRNRRRTGRGIPDTSKQTKNRIGAK
jgi:hypothetical protein